MLDHSFDILTIQQYNHSILFNIKLYDKNESFKDMEIVTEIINPNSPKHNNKLDHHDLKESAHKKGKGEKK